MKGDTIKVNLKQRSVSNRSMVYIVLFSQVLGQACTLFSSEKRSNVS